MGNCTSGDLSRGTLSAISGIFFCIFLTNDFPENELTHVKLFWIRKCFRFRKIRQPEGRSGYLFSCTILTKDFPETGYRLPGCGKNLSIRFCIARNFPVGNGGPQGILWPTSVSRSLADPFVNEQFFPDILSERTDVWV